MRKIAGFLKYSFDGIIASAKRFLWPFTCRWLKEMKTLLNQWICHTNIEVLSTARQNCLKEHSLDLTESKTNTSKLEFDQECSCASTVNELI